MRKILLAIFLLSLSCISKAQQFGINGKVMDTLEKKALSNAVVSLLKKSDSTLVQFSRTNNKGEFALPNVKTGKYVLWITFPKFADLVDEVEVKDAPLQLGTLALTQRAQLLKEVVIRGSAAIRIKGDTTEFAADSFVVKEGATVEDLLKQLPGFQVDSKGNITAQGQGVQKVLVDGEEFFGDDPTMATQNIAAKAVDKVQVYESKTDQDQLKGIGNSNSGKTVNIKLKENSKKGGFGRFHAASDFDKYFDAKGLYNRFVGKKKISLYGTKTNLNTGSLNWEDRQKLGIENDIEYDEVNGYYFSIGNSDEFNDWSLRGLPNSYSAGGLFSNKWNAEKNNFNGSYRFNRLGTTNENSTLTQTILQNDVLYSNSFTKSEGLNQQHAVNGKYEWKIDSLASIKFVTAGIYKTTESFSDINSETHNEKGELLNANDQTRSSSTERRQLDNQLTYKQLFHKKNRQLLVNLRHGYIDDEQDGQLFSKVNFGTASGIPDSTTDQQKKGTGNSQTIGTKITYSEPLSLKWNLVLEYSFNNNNSTSNLSTFNKSNNGKYESLDPLYSNNFDLNATSHGATSTFRYMGTKVRMAFGSGLSSVRLKLKNLDKGTRNVYDFLNMTPQAQFSYTFKPQTGLGISYRGNTRQPTINQLQPLRDNNDPLNIYVGNPNLKVGFVHNFNLNYHSFKILSSTYMFVDGYYSFTDHAVTNSSTIDLNTGKRTYTPINVEGNNNWRLSVYWSRGQGDKKIRLWSNPYINGGQNVNLINGKKGVNNYTNYAVNIGVGYGVNEKYNFSIGPRAGYNKSKSSLQQSINNNYFSYGGRADGFVMLPGKIEISSEVNADLRERISAFDRNTNIIEWNGNISRKIFKGKSGKIIFVAHDILNQNKGFNRIINSNFVSDERYLRVSRYFLLKFEWSFNKMPGANGAKK